MIYELRKKPGTDVPIREFFSKLGIEYVWDFIRTQILGDPKTFIFTLLVSILVFILAKKYESIFMQIISGTVFFGLLIFQIVLI